MTEISLEKISSPVAENLSNVNAIIADQLTSEVPLIGQIGQHIISGGGKRIRPILVLLSSGLIDYNCEDSYRLAAIIEYIHTATLLHDDVVDDAEKRRGKIAAHLQWSRPAAVLAGDFLYTRAFQMMVQLRCEPIMKLMAETTNRIAQGEMLQLAQIGQLPIKRESLQLIARYKTGELFAAACSGAACLAGESASLQRTLYQYGLSLGLAYQMIDDVLDYAPKSALLGKKVGNDLAEGKATLPLVLTYELVSEAGRNEIRQALIKKDYSDFDRIRIMIEENGALAACKNIALDHAHQASAQLNKFESSDYLRSMRALAEFICLQIS